MTAASDETTTPWYEGRKALVTGGAGFIGSHLVEALVRRGAEVTVVDNLASGRLSNLAAVAEQVRVRQLDLTRTDLRQELEDGPFDLVFHLAGNVDVPGSVEAPDRDLELNGLTTFRLLDAVRAVSPRSRMLFASSAAVYGEAGGRPLAESDPAFPVAPYGVSKLMGERYLAVYAPLYGLRTASLRLYPVYGPRLRQHVVYDLIAKVAADPRRLSILGDGRQIRDFTHVADTVDAFLLIAEQAPLAGEVYNVAHGRPLSIRDLARAICEQMGETPEFHFTGSDRRGVSRRWTADVSRLRSLGFRPRVSLDEGLADTVRWFRQTAGRPDD